MNMRIIGAGIAIVIVCGILMIVIGGNFSFAHRGGSLGVTGDPTFKGSLAAYGHPYWSGEPETYIDVSNVPPGDDFIAVSSGVHVLLALRSNGSIECWGDYREGLCDFPRENDYSAISSGGTYSLALRKNGSIVCRVDSGGICEAPAENDFVAVSAGDGNNLALRANGTIVQWGGRLADSVPPGENFIAIAAGRSHNLALRSNGTIACWGEYQELCDVPSGNDYVAVATFGRTSLGLRAGGEIVAWGDDGRYSPVPPGNDYRAISAGSYQNLAIRSNGTIVCWGNSPDDICNSSTTQNAFAASTGSFRVLVLRNLHAKEILDEEWKKTRSRISPAATANASARPIHPAVYPGVAYVIDTTLPKVPDSVMTYIAPRQTGFNQTPIPWNDPELSTNRYIPYKEFSLIPPEQAITEFKTHRLSVDATYLWHNPIGTSDKIIVTNVSLYNIQRHSPSGMICYQPVYTFTGYVRNGTVMSPDFTEDVPATDHLVEFDFL